uniref:Uncharacterized protein n=1 Tax=uncultured Caudovirales phage TaxID=2100421 RepID=A0A6J5LAC6_9CAUD|nr:hypothetical protein UFOVP114_75 [uncultured Caudovirales phage]
MRHLLTLLAAATLALTATAAYAAPDPTPHETGTLTHCDDGNACTLAAPIAFQAARVDALDLHAVSADDVCAPAAAVCDDGNTGAAVCDDGNTCTAAVPPDTQLRLQAPCAALSDLHQPAIEHRRTSTGRYSGAASKKFPARTGPLLH